MRLTSKHAFLGFGMLREYPSLSGAQVYDWLLEHFPTLEVGKSTIRRYVNKMSKSVVDIQQAFKQLRLAETAEELPELLRQAEQVSWTYLEFLEELTKLELRRREEKSIEKRLTWARFPYHKSLHMFQLEEQTAITARQMKQLREFQWLEQSYNLILLGPPGAGKTLLAVGLGIEASAKDF